MTVWGIVRHIKVVVISDEVEGEIVCVVLGVGTALIVIKGGAGDCENITAIKEPIPIM